MSAVPETLLMFAYCLIVHYIEYQSTVSTTLCASASVTSRRSMNKCEAFDAKLNANCIILLLFFYVR
jgi:hypothetical protein